MSEPSRDRLPFEPRQKKKKTPKKAPVATSVTAETTSKSATVSKKGTIPDAVSKRMLKRMVIFSGIPTGLGLSSFFIFYWIATQEWFELPPIVVLFVSLGLFGLGVLGLSYGIFSTSWEEDIDGSWLGTKEFSTNLGRTIAAWREARKEAKGNS